MRDHTHPIQVNKQKAVNIILGTCAGRPKGEARPAETGEFYSVKQMVLKVTAEGVVEAFAPSSSHPAPLEAEAAHAYYLMPSSPGMTVPHKGDLIEVEFRP